MFLSSLFAPTACDRSLHYYGRFGILLSSDFLSSYSISQATTVCHRSLLCVADTLNIRSSGSFCSSHMKKSHISSRVGLLDFDCQSFQSLRILCCAFVGSIYMPQAPRGAAFRNPLLDYIHSSRTAVTRPIPLAMPYNTT
jgi:hypothetical protein